MKKEFNVVLVGLCSYRNFPIRIMHAMLEKLPGVKVHSIFFKEFEGKFLQQPSEKEEDLFAEIIDKVKPDIIGFSVIYPFFPMTKRLIKITKEHSPSTVSIIGGVHPTISPGPCFEVADMLCVGEGEDVFVELIECMRDGKPYDHISNLWMRTNGKVIKNPLGKLRQDLDALPYPAYRREPFYFIDKDTLIREDPLVHYTDLYLVGSRGCPYMCSFCGNTVLRTDFKQLGKFIRKRSVDNIVGEIKENMAMPGSKTNYIYFFDENFNLEMEWVDEFCTKYKRDVDLPFQVSYNPHKLGVELIEKLVGAGLDSLRFGFQTGSDHIRRRIFNRPGKNKDIIEFTNGVAKFGVDLRHDLIMDNPYENAEHMEECIDLFMQLPPESNVDLYSLKHYPSFPLTKKAIADGIIKPIDEFDDREIEATSKDLAFVPKKSNERKEVLQNVMWLVAYTNTNKRLIRYAVFGKSLGSKICLSYLNHKSYLWGKVVGDGGIAYKYRWINFIIRGVSYMRKGNWKGLFAKVKRHFGFRKKNKFAVEVSYKC